MGTTEHREEVKREREVVLCLFLEGRNRLPVREALEKEGIRIPMECGGRGVCGMCRVRFLEYAPKPLAAEKKMFTEEQLREGWRLGCIAAAYRDCRIAVPAADTNAGTVATAVAFFGQDECGLRERTSAADENVSENTGTTVAGSPGKVRPPSFAAAVDIGTTTIAAAILEFPSGRRLAAGSAQNSQRVHGADVISRIRAACSGKAEILRREVWNDTESLLRQLCGQAGIDWEELGDTAAAGNTAMEHIFAGESCQGLGEAPFDPGDISLRRISREGRGVILLPGISAFVGADLAAGIFALEMTERKEPSLLLDLGTNGEMALWDGRRLLVSSVAAGPAFEGGDLRNGMPSLPGAICRVRREKGRLLADTIGEKRPRGGCGTGAVSTLCLLLREGKMDRDGLLEEPYFSQGFPLWMLSQRDRICICQEDVRKLQMAKGAVAAGIEILLGEAGLVPEQMRAVYLAGGMGCALDPAEAAEIGLIPGGFAAICHPAGNSSLEGVCRYLINPEMAKEKLGEITERAEVIQMAEHRDFQEKFLAHMAFPETGTRTAPR